MPGVDNLQRPQGRPGNRCKNQSRRSSVCLSSSSLQNRFRSRTRRSRMKGLSILLFGSECWALSANMRRRLNSFHHRCIRQMCRTTTWQQWKLHIHQHTMESRLDVKCLNYYLARRRLGWAGHLARMDFDKRLPRKLLSAWIDSTRPRGRPQNGFAHGLMTDIKNAGLNDRNWFQTKENGMNSLDEKTSISRRRPIPLVSRKHLPPKNFDGALVSPPKPPPRPLHAALSHKLSLFCPKQTEYLIFSAHALKPRGE